MRAMRTAISPRLAISSGESGAWAGAATRPSIYRRIIQSPNDRSEHGIRFAAMAASTRPSRPALRERWDRRRGDVIAGAARVFAERGYAETSVAELAEQLGLATGALYHYFRGKEELLIAICDELTEPLLEAGRELPAQGRRSSACGRSSGSGSRHVAEHRDHLLVFTQVRHIVDAGGAEWRGVRAARKDFEGLIGAALADCGVADPDLRRLALLGMVNHLPQWYRPRGRLGPEQIADGWVDLVLGLSTSPGSSEDGAGVPERRRAHRRHRSPGSAPRGRPAPPRPGEQPGEGGRQRRHRHDRHRREDAERRSRLGPPGNAAISSTTIAPVPARPWTTPIQNACRGVRARASARVAVSPPPPGAGDDGAWPRRRAACRGRVSVAPAR